MSSLNKVMWSDADVEHLRQMFHSGIPDDVIAATLGRTCSAVKVKRQKSKITGDHNTRRISATSRAKMGGTKPTGADHPFWKGGRRISANGYVEIFSPGHPRARGNGYVFEHILVAEKMIGRPMSDEECVHHIDKDRQNNNRENLIVLSRSEHSSLHCSERPVSRAEVKCSTCGKVFYVKQSHAGRRKTCSLSCVAERFRRAHASGQ